MNLELILCVFSEDKVITDLMSRQENEGSTILPLNHLQSVLAILKLSSFLVWLKPVYEEGPEDGCNFVAFCYSASVIWAKCSHNYTANNSNLFFQADN